MRATTTGTLAARMTATPGERAHRRSPVRAVTLLIAAILVTHLAGCRDDSKAAVHQRTVSGSQSNGTPSTVSRSPSAVSGTAPSGAAASRLVFWTGCDDIVGLSNAELDQWRSRGVGGFVCVIQRLPGLGGDQSFRADPKATLAGDSYSLQRRIRQSKIVERAKARGIKLWLGFYLSNYYNHSTPLENWFDDAAWSKELLPRIGDVAGTAKTLGFAGLAFDEEMYDNGTWDWHFPGNRHSPSQVRAQARTRGAQMMRAILRGFPSVDLIDYGTYFPDGWNALVQREINGDRGAYRDSVQIDFWDGLTSVRGFGAVRFLDATFYKTPHLSGATWDNALVYNTNRSMAYFSRTLENWAYASSRVNVSPFAWIDGDVENEGSFTAPRPPDYVAEQLAAFRRRGMGGMFGVYAYSGLDGDFDYTPYVNGMKAAAQPGVVDSQAPSVTVDDARRDGATVTLTGTATDNMAVRSVRWRVGTTVGVAPMRWTVNSGNYYTSYQWQMDWTATVPASAGQTIAVIAQDTAGKTAIVRQAAP
jgi:hypothetical protein